ncbi:hypothetical protein [Paenibacillus sp. EPM92]|nr:hypothetical protein [Paenibacillus sp. EPM92]
MSIPSVGEPSCQAVDPVKKNIMIETNPRWVRVRVAVRQSRIVKAY